MTEPPRSDRATVQPHLERHRTRLPDIQVRKILVPLVDLRKRQQEQCLDDIRPADIAVLLQEVDGAPKDRLAVKVRVRRRVADGRRCGHHAEQEERVRARRVEHGLVQDRPDVLRGRGRGSRLSSNHPAPPTRTHMHMRKVLAEQVVLRLEGDAIEQLAIVLVVLEASRPLCLVTGRRRGRWLVFALLVSLGRAPGARRRRDERSSASVVHLADRFVPDSTYAQATLRPCLLY